MASERDKKKLDKVIEDSYKDVQGYHTKNTIKIKANILADEKLKKPSPAVIKPKNFKDRNKHLSIKSPHNNK
jgi:hypothetical protein